MCDEKTDCIDKTDEENCLFNETNYHCDGKLSQKVNAFLVCDHFPDCKNLLDEKNCRKKKMLPIKIFSYKYSILFYRVWNQP